MDRVKIPAARHCRTTLTAAFGRHTPARHDRHGHGVCQQKLLIGDHPTTDGAPCPHLSADVIPHVGPQERDGHVSGC